jgi:dihydrofolate reductase
MSRVRVHGFTLSIDGCGAGPGQDEQHPLGVGGQTLHPWLVSTRTFRQMIGEAGGTTGIDDAFAVAGSDGIGATIMGRNMFGPVRGPWPDASWKGWWGPDPPYHTPVFVLTHHARASIAMAGGTTFHFVTDGIEAALARARDAAGALDVRIGGGVSTVRQYLAAGLVDEMHLAISPVLLGTGEQLLAGLDLARLGFACTRHESTPAALHVVLTKSAR